MRTTKLFAAAGLLLAAALVGGTLIGSALAAPQRAAQEPDSAPDARPGLGAYCDAFLDAFAAELGVARDAITPAARAAANAAVDAAVAEGTLSEERAARMKERIDALEGDACTLAEGWGRVHAGGQGRGGGGGGGGGLGLGGLLGPAADQLGVTPGELRGALRAGTSLHDVAAEQGVAYDTVKAAILDAVAIRLDEAVADGMAQERANEALGRAQAWLDAGGQPDAAPGGGRGHGGHGRPPWAGGEEEDDD